jgi:phosphoglycerol transferase MdoB-like AlkP superfamily enzyme
MKLLKTKIFLWLVIGSLLLIPLVFAQAQGETRLNLPGAVEKTSVGGVVDVLRSVVRWVYIIFFIIAVMFILFAAFSYLTAGGDPETVAKAKNQIIYAAIAIAVALLAVGFEQIIRTFLQSGT